MTSIDTTVMTALNQLHGLEATTKFSVAEVKEIVYPLTQALREFEKEKETVHLSNLNTKESLTYAFGFDSGEELARGYLLGIGGQMNDGNRILVHSRKTGKYSIVIVGGILESGEDWDRLVLVEKLETAQKALDEATVAIADHDHERETQQIMADVASNIKGADNG